MRDARTGIDHYRPEVDGLRAVAVLAAVGYHFFPGIVRGGFAGPEVFFLISGYLITGIVLRAQAAGRFSLVTFYRRRVVRIVPALLLVLAATALLGALLQNASDYAVLGRHLAAGALMVPNLLLMTEAGYFDRAADYKPLLQLWSLGVEEQFYLVWPALMVLLAAALSVRYRWVAVTVLAVLSLVWGIYTSYVDPVVAFYSPVGRAWEFLLGALLARSSNHTMAADGHGSATRDNVLAFSGAALVMASFALFHRGLAYPGWAALVPAGGAMMLLAAGPQAWLHRRVLARPAWVYIGRISYPWYLWHWPLLALARPYAEALQLYQWVALKLVLIALSLGLAAVTYRWIEEPARRVQERGRAGPLAAALLAGLVAIAALGAAVVAADGLPQRAPDTVAGQAALVTELERTGICKAERVAGCSTAAPRWQDIETVFVGDSHALSWFVGAPPSNSAYFGTPGCFPGVGVKLLNRVSIVAADCEVYAALPALLARMPSLRTVVIGTRGPMYLDGAGFGIDAGRYDWVVAGEAPGQRAALLAQGLTRVLDSAAAAPSKPQVWLMQSVPELGFSPTECVVSRPPDWLLPRRVPCALPRSTVDARQADFRALVESLPGVRAGRVQVFDPLPVLCDADACHAQRDDVLWYADGDHLAPVGARGLLARLPR